MLPIRISLFCLIVLALSPRAPAADVLVICPDDFRPALAPWLDHRRQQGHAIDVVQGGGSAAEVHAAIRAAAQPGALRFVVLVGDATANTAAASRRRLVPTESVTARVNLVFGSEPQIASDNPYADLDGDQVPDLAIGRIPADTPAELVRIVDKILAYERTADFGPWRQRVHFVAGLGGFGQLIDAALESWATRLITDKVPAAYATTMTYGSWTSPYCPDPRRFRDTAIDRLSEGSLFWVYIGHGQSRDLDEVHVPGDAFPILSASDADLLDCRQGPPIGLFMACYTGAYDTPRDCLAEELLRAKGGPVAVIAGSRVTMPYAMAVLGTELLRGSFQDRQPTVGELLLAAKRNSILRDRSDEESSTLDAAATAFSPRSSDLPAERMEHLALFNLIGDPLLRLSHPGTIRLEAPATALAGGTLEITGNTDLAGHCTVELVVRRDRLRFKAPTRPDYLDTPEFLDGYQVVYEAANDPRLTAVELDIQPGVFQASLEIPPEARGACHVRAFITGTDACALGAADVKIQRPPRARSADRE